MMKYVPIASDAKLNVPEFPVVIGAICGSVGAPSNVPLPLSRNRFTVAFARPASELSTPFPFASSSTVPETAAFRCCAKNSFPYWCRSARHW